MDASQTKPVSIYYHAIFYYHVIFHNLSFYISKRLKCLWFPTSLEALGRQSVCYFFFIVCYFINQCIANAYHGVWHMKDIQ